MISTGFATRRAMKPIRVSYVYYFNYVRGGDISGTLFGTFERYTGLICDEIIMNTDHEVE